MNGLRLRIPMQCSSLSTSASLNKVRFLPIFFIPFNFRSTLLNLRVASCATKVFDNPRPVRPGKRAVCYHLPDRSHRADFASKRLYRQYPYIQAQASTRQVRTMFGIFRDRYRQACPSRRYRGSLYTETLPTTSPASSSISALSTGRSGASDAIIGFRVA